MDALSVTTYYRWTTSSRSRPTNCPQSNRQEHRCPLLTTHIPINLPPLRPFHTDRMAALTFHPAAFFPRPREAAVTARQPLHHYCSPPLRTLVPRTTRPCLLRARSSNGLPQIGGASFGSSNGIASRASPAVGICERA